MKAVILAAGVGSRLAPLTADRPKVLVEVGGRSFLLRQLDRLAQAGIPNDQVVVVGGYRIDQLRRALDGRGCTVVANDRYDTWQNFYSLLVAAPALAGADFLQLDGDVLLDDRLLPALIAAPGPGVLAVDRSAELDDDAMKVQLAADGRVTAVSKQLPARECAGEYLGIAKLTAAAAREVFADLERFAGEGLTHEYYDHAYHRLASRGRVPFSIADAEPGAVIEIDDLADLQRAEQLLARPMSA